MSSTDTADETVDITLTPPKKKDVSVVQFIRPKRKGFAFSFPLLTEEIRLEKTRGQIIYFDHKIGFGILERVNEISDLGVLFDSGLSFGPHISRIVSSANRMLGFIISNGRDFSDLNVRKPYR
nr:unnamed protein product [Callosobruchus chinensis]